MTLTFNFTQMVNTPTRGANILDLVLVSNPDIVKSLSSVEGLSDHNLVLFNLCIPRPVRQRSIKHIRDYNKANFTKINSELSEFLDYFRRSASLRSVDDNWLLFKNKLTSLVELHVPLVRIRGDLGKPWFSNTLKRLLEKKKRLFRDAKRSVTSSKWEKYFTSLRQYTSALRQSKKKFFHHDLQTIMRVNPKKFWKILTPSKSSNNISLSYPDGSNVPIDERSDVINSYFSSVFTNEPTLDDFDPPNLSLSDMPPIIITSQGILKLIEKMKISSAPGHDGITAKILKGTKVFSSSILEIIFTQSITDSSLPTDWKINKVVPVYKSGSRSDPSNYRPISLTSIACKLLEHIIYSQIACHLGNHSFFFPNQHGFRPNLSCDTQLFEFVTELHLNLDSCFQTDVIYLDFAKAFDCVPHQRLLAKLSSLQLDPLALSWIRCFLTNRLQYTVVGNHCSATTNVISGVPQGSVLGPLLFLIFINDLPNGISSSIRLFADDCVLYRRIAHRTDHEIIQSDLHQIESWCSNSLMKLNISKCKVMQISRKRSNSNYTYSLNSIALSLVESYRYLGVTINKKLTWSDHITKLAADTTKSLGYIRRSLSLCPSSTRKLAYETFIRSKLEYASAIWSPHQAYLINTLESIQHRAARFISSRYGRDESISAIKSSLGLESLSFRRKIARLCLFHRLYYNFPHLHGKLFIPPTRTSRRLFNSCSVQRLHGSTSSFNQSFLPTAIAEWNTLPDSVVVERNPIVFKQLLTDHLTL